MIYKGIYRLQNDRCTRTVKGSSGSGQNKIGKWMSNKKITTLSLR